jgi:hypothetical protein
MVGLVREGASAGGGIVIWRGKRGMVVDARE